MQGYKYIDKIGIELEAAWKNPRKDLVIDESFSIHDFPGYPSVGELVSKPISSKTEMLKWLNDNWPDETCAKCAMHVHFSLNHINYYSACMSNRFYEYFLVEMKKWGESYPCTNELFWQRLNGENRYCKKRFNPDKQASYREKGHNRQDRRDHWNFCWGLHRTMECRLLPMFKNIDTAISAVNALINCIETYLDNYPHDKQISDELFDFDCGSTPEEDNSELDRYNLLKKESLERPFSPEESEEFTKLHTYFKETENKKKGKKLAFNYFEDFDLSIKNDRKEARPANKFKFVPPHPIPAKVLEQLVQPPIYMPEKPIAYAPKEPKNSWYEDYIKKNTESKEIDILKLRSEKLDMPAETL